MMPIEELGQLATSVGLTLILMHFYLYWAYRSQKRLTRKWKQEDIRQGIRE